MAIVGPINLFRTEPHNYDMYPLYLITFPYFVGEITIGKSPNLHRKGPAFAQATLPEICGITALPAVVAGIEWGLGKTQLEGEKIMGYKIIDDIDAIYGENPRDHQYSQGFAGV